PDRGLLPHLRRLGVAQPRWAVTAKVRNEHSMAGGGQRRYDTIKGSDIVGKAMEQDYRKPLRRTAVFVSDGERRRLNRHGSSTRLTANKTGRNSAAGGLKKRSAASKHAYSLYHAGFTF